MAIKDKLMGATGLATLLSNLGITAEETKKAGDMLVDFEINKATHAESLTAGEHVKDRWDAGEMHKTPTAEEIKVGPPQHSSGGGVDKMIGHYSPNKAPQDGTVVTPERLAEHLGHFSGYARATNDAIRVLGKGQETLTQVLTAFLTKTAAEETGGEPGEAARFGQTFASKADQFLRAAKTTLSKSRQLRDSLDEVDGGAERKAIKAQIRDMRKRAARLVLKSLAASYAAKSDEADPAEAVRKSIHTLLEDDAVLKADMSALHDKDKDKDEEKKTKKAIKRAAKKAAAKAAAKAAKKAGAAAPVAAAAAAETQKGDDKGHQADKQDPENKNQSASSKGLNEDVLEQVNKALSGQAMLEGSVNEIMDLLRGKVVNKQAAQPLELMKGEPGQVFLTLDNRISEGVATGRLDPAAEMKARDLLQKTTAVRSGVMPVEAWNDLVAQSPTVVKNIFAEAA